MFLPLWMHHCCFHALCVSIHAWLMRWWSHFSMIMRHQSMLIKTLTTLEVMCCLQSWNMWRQLFIWWRKVVLRTMAFVVTTLWWCYGCIFDQFLRSWSIWQHLMCKNSLCVFPQSKCIGSVVFMTKYHQSIVLFLMEVALLFSLSISVILTC